MAAFKKWICLGVCALFVCIAFREALACEGTNLEKIVKVLTEVNDWENLAGWLNLGRGVINGLKTHCLREGDGLAGCYHRKLVTAYCDETGRSSVEVAHDIAHILESDMASKSQADRLRSLFFEGQAHTVQHSPLLTKVKMAAIGSPLLLAAFGSPILLTVAVYMCTGDNRLTKFRTQQILFAMFVLGALMAVSLNTTVEQQIHSQNTVISDITAITRYADYLRAVYANRPVAKSDKWPPTPSTVYIKLAFVKKARVSEAEADEFTRLTLQGDIDTIMQAKERIEMDDIIDKTRLVVVEGAPGIGKSTFAWELCRQWSTLESLNHFSLVVLLNLREEGVQTATHITDLFPCGDDPDLSRLVAEEVRRENGKGVLFVFDGFDEFPAKLREKSLVTDIISGSSYLPKATVLVTSRPSATVQLQSFFQTSIGKHIEIVGFSHKEIHEYAESVLGSGSEMLASFKTYLSANPVVKAMMYNPLNSAIVVEVYRKTSESGKPIPHTQTQLYTELTLCLLSRHLSAAGDPLANELPDRLEDIPHDNHSLYDWVTSFCKWLFYETQERYTYLKLTSIGQQLFKLGKLAFKGRVREEAIFKQLPEGCSDLGLLVEHRALYAHKEITNFNFFHLTHQEYLAAFYISQLPANKQRTLFIEHGKSRHLRVVWKFLAGLTRMQNIGWDVFKTHVLDSRESGYVIDDAVVVHSFTVQCFYEAQDVQSCESAFGQSRVRFVGAPNDVYAFGYCVSVCSNTWKVQLPYSHCNSERFGMLMYGLKSVEYGGGSIDELFLPGCGGVIEGGHLVQLPHQILQNIRYLYLSKCSLDQQGLDILADSIPYLDSLTSLSIIDNPGGIGSTVKLLRALRQHGKLETLYMSNIAIGMEDVAALSDLIKSPGSLRELSVGDFQSKRLVMIASLHRHDDTRIPPDVLQQLFRTVLSSSSLETLSIRYFIHFSTFPLDHIEIISGSLTTITFMALISPLDSSPPFSFPQSSSSAQLLSVNTSPEQLTANRGVKGGTKLSRILRENTSLRVLKLCIPLDTDEVRDIVDSLEDNHSLKKLALFASDQQALNLRIEDCRGQLS